MVDGPRLDVEAPPPPRPGSVEQGVGVQPEWSFVALPHREHARTHLLSFNSHMGPFRACVPTRDIRTLLDEGRSWSFSQTLEGNSAEVHITGTLTPGADSPHPLPAEASKYLQEVTGQRPRQYMEDSPHEGRIRGRTSVLVGDDGALDLLRRVRSGLGAGWLAYLVQDHQIVVGPGVDQFGIPRLARTSGREGNLGTEGLVSWLRAHHQVWPFDITGAGSHDLVVEYTDLPADHRPLLADVHAALGPYLDDEEQPAQVHAKQLADRGRLEIRLS